MSEADRMRALGLSTSLSDDELAEAMKWRFTPNLESPPPQHNFMAPIDRNSFLGMLADTSGSVSNFLGKSAPLGLRVEPNPDWPGVAPDPDFPMSHNIVRTNKPPVLIDLLRIPYQGASEVLDDGSYGFSPVHGRGQTARLDPRVVDVFDAAAIPAGLATGLLRSGGRRLSTELADRMARTSEAPVDTSRREFNKGLASTVATVAAAGTGIPMARQAATQATKQAAKQAVAKPAASKVLGNIIKKEATFWGEALAPAASFRGADVPLWHRDDLGKNILKGYADDSFDINKFYSPEEVAKLQKLIDRLPDDADVETLIARAFQTSERGTTKVDPLDYDKNYLGLPSLDQRAKYFEVEAVDVDLERVPNSHRASGTYQKMMDVAKKLDRIPAEDFDLWLLSGKRPAQLTDEDLFYISPWEIQQSGDLFRRVGARYVDDLRVDSLTDMPRGRAYSGASMATSYTHPAYRLNAAALKDAGLTPLVNSPTLGHVPPDHHVFERIIDE